MASPNMAKLTSMVHFIINAMNAEQLGMTKLNKILWFSDRAAYLKYGTTISGDTYIRRPKGPVSASLDVAIKCLVQNNLIRMDECQGKPKHLFYSLAMPAVASLTQDERAIISEQIDRIRPLTADETNELSHDYTWEMYEDNEEIDMASVLARPGEITPEGLAWAKSVL